MGTEDPSKLPRSPHRVLLEKQFRRELQDSAGRMVSGIAASIKRRMGDEDAGAALPASAGAYLSPSRARDMAVRDAQSAHVDRFALEAAMRGDNLDRRLTEELRIEEALRMDAGAAAAAGAL